MGACLGKTDVPAFPDDSIHVALNKHRKPGVVKKKSASAYSNEYVPRAPHPLMNSQKEASKEDGESKVESAAP